MKRILFLSLLALSGCATAPPQEQGSQQLTIPAARVAECEAAGGCAFISKAEVVALMQQAWQIGADQAAQQFTARLDSHGCLRGDV